MWTPYCPLYTDTTAFQDDLSVVFMVLCQVDFAGPLMNHENQQACCLFVQPQSLVASTKFSNQTSKSSSVDSPLNLSILLQSSLKPRGCTALLRTFEICDSSSLLELLDSSLSPHDLKCLLPRFGNLSVTYAQLFMTCYFYSKHWACASTYSVHLTLSVLGWSQCAAAVELLVQHRAHTCWPAAVCLIMHTLFLIYSCAYLTNLPFCTKHSNMKLPYCDTSSVLDTDCRPAYLEPLHMSHAPMFHTCHTAWPSDLALLPFRISHRHPQVLQLYLQVVIPERNYLKSIANTMLTYGTAHC